MYVRELCDAKYLAFLISWIEKHCLEWRAQMHSENCKQKCKICIFEALTAVNKSIELYTFQWNERTIQFNEGTRTGKPVSLMVNNMYWTELNERTTHIGVNTTRFTQWNSRWSNVKLENCTHGENREQSAKTATEVSWVHWILATGAVNEVAIQLRKKEKCFRFNLSADMHWLIVYTKFSWAWDSGRYRHKRSKARCLGQPEF